MRSLRLQFVWCKHSHWNTRVQNVVSSFQFSLCAVNEVLNLADISWGQSKSTVRKDNTTNTLYPADGVNRWLKFIPRSSAPDSNTVRADDLGSGATASRRTTSCFARGSLAPHAYQVVCKLCLWFTDVVQREIQRKSTQPHPVGRRDDGKHNIYLLIITSPPKRRQRCLKRKSLGPNEKGRCPKRCVLLEPTQRHRR